MAITNRFLNYFSQSWTRLI